MSPSAEDLRAASLWCDHYEGTEAEQAQFKRVSEWLEEQAAAQELRELAREHGVPVAKLRAAMRAKGMT